MKALILNCSLKDSSTHSSSGKLAQVVAGHLHEMGVESEEIRIADVNMPHGVESDMGNGDEWPSIRQKIIDSEILIVASSTWVSRMSSYSQKILERMDAMLGETDDQGRPVAYNHVAGVVATGNEDGAKNVIGEIEAALLEIGFTIPGQSWTYFNNGAAMGPDYIDSENKDGIKRAHDNAKLAAHNLVAVAKALQSNPISKPD